MYITAEETEKLFPRDAEEPLPLTLKRQGAGDLWLADTVRGKLITPGNRRLQSLGIYSLNLRGWKNYSTQIHRAGLAPCDEVDLVHEPTNKYDPNAVYISAPNSPGVLGYLNKGLAKQVAKHLGSGAPLEARVLRCPPDSFQFSIVFCSSQQMSCLLS